MKNHIVFILFACLTVFGSMEVAAKKKINNQPPDTVAVRVMKATDKYLNMPVRTGAPQQMFEIYSDGQKVREFSMEFDAENPMFWVNLDIGEWIGKNIEIRTKDKNTEPLLSTIYQSARPAGYETFYKESIRPGFHLTSQRGWNNDPNGMIYHDGQWHLFWQHNPYGTGWGNMTWGYAVSNDMFHWKEKGDAIHPDQLGTIFSGSGIVDHENLLGFQKDGSKTLVLFYTYAPNESWSLGKKFTQGMAYSTDNGKTWIKYDKNPIVGYLYDGTRDPKVVWDAGSKLWVMTLFLDGNHGYGIFTSKDLINWKEIQRLKLEHDGECPDFFPIKVEGANEIKWIFSGANKNYVVGDFDGQKFTYDPKQKLYEVGANFYAAQTFDNAPAGRRVQIGWMTGSHFPDMPFGQQMSVPRDLKLYKENGEYILKSLPSPEIENIFTGVVHTWPSAVVKSGDNVTSSFRGNMYALDAEIDVSKSKSDGFGFSFDGFEVYYSIKDKKLIMNKPGGGDKREAALEPENGLITLKVLVDVNSVEVFANDGEVAGTFAHLPKNRDEGVRTIVNGEVKMNKLTIRDAESTWLK